MRMKLTLMSFSAFELFSESCSIFLHTHSHTYICYWYSFLWFFIWPFNYCLETWRNLKTSVFHFTFHLTRDFSTIAWKAEEIWEKKKNQNKESSQGYIQLYNSKIGIEYLTSFSGLPTPNLTKGVTGGRGGPSIYINSEKGNMCLSKRGMVWLKTWHGFSWL